MIEDMNLFEFVNKHSIIEKKIGSELIPHVDCGTLKCEYCEIYTKLKPPPRTIEQCVSVFKRLKNIRIWKQKADNMNAT